MELKSSDIKIAEKFVFKSVSLENSLGVCQQGFRVCTCKTNNTLSCTKNDNFFAVEASKADHYDLQDSSTNGEIKYMFCARMSVPLSDWKESCFSLLHEYNVSHANNNKQCVVPAKEAGLQREYMITCRHRYQVYPEFLIVFKKL